MSQPDRPGGAAEVDRTAKLPAPDEAPGAPSPLGGHYEILERAGAGAMGTVYRARDLATGAVVAVKIANIAGVRGAERSRGERGERLVREGRALAELRH